MAERNHGTTRRSFAMEKTLVSSTWALGFIAITLVGCNRKNQDGLVRSNEPSAAEQRTTDERAAEERTGEPRSIGGGPRTPASAQSNIATARCDREVRCNNVGPNAKFETRVACTVEMKKDDRGDLSGEACPGGINEKELAKCVAAIRAEDCKNPLDVIGKLNNCRTSNLCIK
jgi:uncharacterized protein DUF6184